VNRDRVLTSFLVTAWIAIAFVATRAGWDYYTVTLIDRPDSPLHEALKPTGGVGHMYGIVGAAMMAIGVAGYSLRRRLGILAGAGKLSSWLQVHIFLCTLGPYLVLLHTTLKLGGIVSIAFWSMMIVVFSGIFGRYVYAQIPHGVEGNVRDLKDLAEEGGRLEAALREHQAIQGSRAAGMLIVPTTPEPRGAIHALALSFSGSIVDRAHLRRARAHLVDEGVPRRMQKEILGLIKERRRLLRSGTLARSFRRMFGYWHLLHLPLAILLLIVTVLHIGVAYLFGYA
jgi:hypothetical protein